MKSAIFKNLRVTFLVATLIVVAGYGILFYVIKLANISIATAYIGIEAREKQSSTADSLKKTLESYKDDIDLVSRNFVNSDGAVSFIEYLENLGKSVGAEVVIQDVVESDASSVASKKSQLRFRIVAQGSWKSVYRFLALLENAPYVILVENAEFRKNSGGETLVSNAFQGSKGSGTKKITGDWIETLEFTVLKEK